MVHVDDDDDDDDDGGGGGGGDDGDDGGDGGRDGGGDDGGDERGDGGNGGDGASCSPSNCHGVALGWRDPRMTFERSSNGPQTNGHRSGGPRMALERPSD